MLYLRCSRILDPAWEYFVAALKERGCENGLYVSAPNSFEKILNATAEVLSYSFING